MATFIDHVSATFLAILPLAIIAVISAILTRKNILSDHVTKGLSDGVVYLFLPALIFDKITSGFDPAGMTFWWMIPLSALALFILGGILTLLMFPIRIWKSPDILPLAFMQNAGYLIVALGFVLVPEDYDRFSAFVFLFVLGHSPLLWSFGKYFISRNPQTVFKWKELITPPLIANLAALSVVLAGIYDYIPAPVSSSINQLGIAAVPVALVVLGSSLARIKLNLDTEWSIVIKAITLKLLIIPACVIPIIFMSGINATQPLLALMLVLQATSPQAVNLIIHVRTYGGNIERTGSIMMISYLCSIITIPVWIAIWNSVN